MASGVGPKVCCSAACAVILTTAGTGGASLGWGCVRSAEGSRRRHAIHVPDSRTRMEGIDPIDLFGRGDVDVNDSCMLVAADNQVTERLGLARLDLPPLDGDEISGQIDR